GLGFGRKVRRLRGERIILGTSRERGFLSGAGFRQQGRQGDTAQAGGAAEELAASPWGQMVLLETHGVTLGEGQNKRSTRAAPFASGAPTSGRTTASFSSRSRRCSSSMAACSAASVMGSATTRCSGAK